MSQLPPPAGDTETQYLSTEGEYGSLVSGYGDGQTSYYGFDALGSTDVLLDDSGSVTARYEYRAFGLGSASGGGESPGMALPAPLPSELGGGTSAATGQPFAFVGREHYFRDSETELYLLGGGGGSSPGKDGRYYDPASARFLSKDPIEEAGGSPNLPVKRIHSLRLRKAPTIHFMASIHFCEWNNAQCRSTFGAIVRAAKRLR